MDCKETEGREGPGDGGAGGSVGELAVALDRALWEIAKAVQIATGKDPEEFIALVKRLSRGAP